MEERRRRGRERRKKPSDRSEEIQESEGKRRDPPQNPEDNQEEVLCIPTLLVKGRLYGQRGRGRKGMLGKPSKEKWGSRVHRKGSPSGKPKTPCQYRKIRQRWFFGCITEETQIGEEDER